VDRSVQGQAGIFSFRVNGGLYHDIGSVLPENNARAAFSQIYVTGGNDRSKAEHQAVQSRSNLHVPLLFRIQTFLTNHNTYAQFFRMIGETRSPSDNSTYVLQNFARAGLDQRVYNEPRTLEVGMVIDNDSDEEILPRSIILRTTGGGLYHVTDEFSGYLPIRYPLFFPFGDQGWIDGWPSSTDRGMSQFENSLHQISPELINIKT
jgi:hypothetical protein